MVELDVVVLASGDGDFAPLLEYLQMTGQLTETVAFGKSTSSKIKELTDHFIDLDEDTRRFLMAIKGGRSGGRTPGRSPQAGHARNGRGRCGRACVRGGARDRL